MCIVLWFCDLVLVVFVLFWLSLSYSIWCVFITLFWLFSSYFHEFCFGPYTLVLSFRNFILAGLSCRTWYYYGSTYGHILPGTKLETTRHAYCTWTSWISSFFTQSVVSVKSNNAIVHPSRFRTPTLDFFTGHKTTPEK